MVGTILVVGTLLVGTAVVSLKIGANSGNHILRRRLNKAHTEIVERREEIDALGIRLREQINLKMDALENLKSI